MATKKAEFKDITVEQKLKNLYDLQTLLSKIDEIKILRGGLPLEVQDLDDEIAGLTERVRKIQEEIANHQTTIIKRKKAIEVAESMIEKYKEQIDNVRNNREYDTLSKEIEFQTLDIELHHKRIKESEQQILKFKEDIEQLSALLKEKHEELAVKRVELDEIKAETQAEEEELRMKAKDLEVTIETRLLTAFKRIRKNARNGLGVVTVRRASCGGCFNSIPPQRQLDIRSRKKVIVCEYCGRILVDPEMAGIVAEVVEETKPKRRTRKLKTEV